VIGGSGPDGCYLGQITGIIGKVVRAKRLPIMPVFPPRAVSVVKS
jgi:hypothetical protein